MPRSKYGVARICEYCNQPFVAKQMDTSCQKATNGTKSYKPKRDENGLIICKSKFDQETVIYADNVRKFQYRTDISKIIFTRPRS